MSTLTERQEIQMMVLIEYGFSYAVIADVCDCEVWQINYVVTQNFGVRVYRDHVAKARKLLREHGLM